MSIKEKILSFVLSVMETGGECHYTHLIRRFVDGGICSKQTLLKYKRELEIEGKLKKRLGRNGKPYYYIPKEYLDDVRRLRREMEAFSLAKNTDPILVQKWIEIGRFLFTTALENETSALQIKICNRATGEEKVVYALSLPWDKVPEIFRDESREDYHYLPFALLFEIMEWGGKSIGGRLSWKSIKQRLKIKPSIKSWVEQQLNKAIEHGSHK